MSVKSRFLSPRFGCSPQASATSHLLVAALLLGFASTTSSCVARIQGGCAGTDTDGDGTPDDCDPCPNDFNNDSDGDARCDSDDICPGFNDSADSDSDGTPDGCDPCPEWADAFLGVDGTCRDKVLCSDAAAPVCESPTRCDDTGATATCVCELR